MDGGETSRWLNRKQPGYVTVMITVDNDTTKLEKPGTTIYIFGISGKKSYFIPS